MSLSTISTDSDSDSELEAMKKRIMKHVGNKTKQTASSSVRSGSNKRPRSPSPSPPSNSSEREKLMEKVRKISQKIGEGKKNREKIARDM